MDAASAVAACRKEIIELHQFFERWFADVDVSDDAFDAFIGRFSDDFTMVTPAGTAVTKAGLGGMRGGCARDERRPPIQMAHPHASLALSPVPALPAGVARTRRGGSSQSNTLSALCPIRATRS
jgi:hypothetical protein